MSSLVPKYLSLSSKWFPSLVCILCHCLVRRVLKRLGNYHVDVSINAEDGLRAIDIVKDYSDKMQALRPLVLLMKVLLMPRGLGSAATSGLGSYAVICMVVFFLKVSVSLVLG